MTEKSVIVDFEPIGRRVNVDRGATLLDAARQAGVEIVSICGGMGTCEDCRVLLVSGEVSAPTIIEQTVFSEPELAAGNRLACQTEVLSSVKVLIPPESLTTPQRLQLEGLETSQAVGNEVKVLDLDLAEPDLNDLRSDSQRLRQALEDMGAPETSIRYPVLRTLSDDLRSQEWKAGVVVQGSEVIGVLPPGEKSLGLAVDIGTTKVAAYLLDLENGQVLARQSAMNPQIHYGEDVVSRIFYCMEHPQGRQTLQSRIVDTLNQLIEGMCVEVGCRTDQIVDAAVVGNTAMHHFFAGLPVQQLGLVPFVPAASEPLLIAASEIGLHLAPAAQVYLPANIAGYVGADHVAMMLATQAYQAEDTVLAVDVGTNTEISLVSAGRILCCSCASGPAFEGAHIREGMRAAVGAIERVQIEGDTVRYYTIGGQPPVGICGSGILDAVAEMVKAGVLDERGVMTGVSGGVHGEGKNREFLLVPAEKSGHGRVISITRRDIHEILLAKAAIRTGIDILLESAGIQAGQIDRFIVAGAFGTYLDLKSAVRIGMFPNLPLERFSQVGNAAGSGARQMLVSLKMRQEASDFARKMEYIELTVHPSFKNVFMKSMDFRSPAG